MYLFYLHIFQSGQQVSSTYRIDDEITSPSTRVLFVQSEQNNQKKCLKIWVPLKDDLYNTEEPAQRIKYLLEGLKYNRRFASGVYLGIASIKKKGGNLLELGPVLKKPDVNRRHYNEALNVLEVLDTSIEIKITKENIDVYRQIVNSLQRAFKELTDLFQRRYEEGRIRRCHGDLKCTNLWVQPTKFLFLSRKKVLALDCIDFRDDFCHIDTLSDVAMLAIDIEMHLLDQPCKDDDKAAREELVKYFLDRYLHEARENAEEVLPILEYYMVEKSIVCAFISILYDEDFILGKKYLDVALAHADELKKRSQAVQKTAFLLDTHSNLNHSG